MLLFGEFSLLNVTSDLLEIPIQARYAHTISQDVTTSAMYTTSSLSRIGNSTDCMTVLILYLSLILWTLTVCSPDNNFNALHYDEVRKQLVACSSIPVVWDEGEPEQPAGVTHDSPIIGLYYLLDFDQLLSTDTSADLIIWHCATGKKKALRVPSITEEL